ncbi:glycosyltransferase [Methylosinus sp. Sm6]|nr:glycosyltransferase [Methylosinus sp. Sm6]
MVHAAWHSCGSYQLNVSQLLAYRALGARTISIAVMDAPSPPPPDGGRWPAYIAATSDLPADARYFCGPTRMGLPAWWRVVHGDEAGYLIEMTKRVELPSGVERERIDLVHANHFFTLPLVARLKAARDLPVLLETQDIQARQFVLRNETRFCAPPVARYEDLLAVELDWMRRADRCIHLNAEENADFARLLPQSSHRLVYPAIAPVACGPGGERVIFVASNNLPNRQSLRWLLAEALPLAPQVAIEIYGNIDSGLAGLDRPLYEAHRHLFKGRVEDLNAVYAQSAAVLLPTIEGHGLSIKTVEAMSSGAPLIATRHAFRGMGFDPASLRNVTLADDAASFAAALRAIGTRSETTSRGESDTRRLYDEKFSFDAYARALEEAAAPLLRA